MQLLDFFGKSTSGKWAVLFISFGLGISLSYIALIILGYDIKNLAEIFYSPSREQGLDLGWANAFQQLGMFGFSWLLLKNQFESSPAKNQLGSLSFTLILGMIWLIASYGLIEFLGTINQSMLSFSSELQNWAHQKELSSLKIQTAILANNQGWGFIQVIFLVAIIPGFFEELFFRSILLRWKMQIMNPFLAIALNGFIFSFIHFQFEGFLARWLLGIMLGWIYWRTGKIWVSIGLHIFNNALSVLLYIFVYQEMNFAKDHWIHHPAAILGSSLFFIGGWKAIDYLWRPKGIYS